MRRFLATLTVLACSTPIAIALMASDHKDGPSTTADQPADITDLYAWHNSTANTFTAVLDFAGLRPPGAAAIYDPNVLYAIHINRVAAGATFTNTNDVEIDIRFAQNAAGGWGVQVVGVPGAAGPIAGTVEATLSDGPRLVYAGLRDDPFFFDLDGFHATQMTGQLKFSNTHDTFAGTNVTAIVIQMALTDVTVNGTLPKLSCWATTGRMPEANARITPSQPAERLAMR